jgi:hypothetical protein
MTLGKAGVAGDGPDTFNMPSAVLVAPNGDIFVGDGHGGMSNARIVKFSKDGKFIKTWGKKGSAPGDFDAQGPHALAMDSRGRLFVGDRGNNRIQIFDQDGKVPRGVATVRPAERTVHRPQRHVVRRGSPVRPANQSRFHARIRIGSIKDGKVTTFIRRPLPCHRRRTWLLTLQGTSTGR